MEYISDLHSAANGSPETRFTACPSHDIIKAVQSVTAGDFTSTPAKSLRALQNEIGNADITGARMLPAEV